MSRGLRVGIVAPSSKVSSIELELGIERLRAEGFSVRAHKQTRASHLFFAGSDTDRSAAFMEMARDPDLDVIWCARGGYGSARILPALLRESAGVAPSRKLLVGYSDATALMNHVREHWGWATLHAPMPGLRSFCGLSSAEWDSIVACVRGEGFSPRWLGKPLRWISDAPSEVLQGLLIGGNLCVWTSLVGTPHLPSVEGKMVFFEDVDESFYRIDRMLVQLRLSGALRGARALVLGNFLGCRDVVPNALAKPPSARLRARMVRAAKPADLKPVRKAIPDARGIREIFADFGRHEGIPVAQGLPVGHGPDHFPLPLGAEYRLGTNGRLEFLSWDWLRKLK